MALTSLYPVLMSADVASTAAFYRNTLGAQTIYDSDWYVSLRLGQFELAIVAHDHPSVPEPYRALPRGVIVNLEVDDATAVHHQLVVERGLETVLSLRDEDFGQRHFILAGPEGVLLDIIEPIAPTAEFTAAYATP